MSAVRRAVAGLGALLVVLVGSVLLATPAQAATPATTAEPKRWLLVTVYALAVVLVGAVVAWVAWTQWGPRTKAQEEDR